MVGSIGGWVDLDCSCRRTVVDTIGRSNSTPVACLENTLKFTPPLRGAAPSGQPPPGFGPTGTSDFSGRGSESDVVNVARSERRPQRNLSERRPTGLFLSIGILCRGRGCRDCGERRGVHGERSESTGLDLAKSVLQGARSDGWVAFRQTLSRAKLLSFFVAMPSCPVAMEACATAQHWARQIGALAFQMAEVAVPRNVFADILRSCLS
jgi:hypothetical protein